MPYNKDSYCPDVIFKISDIEESAEFYYPDDNEDINSDKEIVNFLKEQKSVNTERKTTSARQIARFGCSDFRLVVIGNTSYFPA